MTLPIPEFSLVLLVGPSSSGKSSFAKGKFLPTEVVSSDFCRALICDDENELSAIGEGFELLNHIVELRLKRGKLTVVDATNTQRDARKNLIRIARKHHALTAAIVFDMPEKVLLDRHQQRSDRADMPERVIFRQRKDMKRSLRGMSKEGFHHIHILSSPEQADAAELERTRLWCRKPEITGPFDIIGDVHGCRTELDDLLSELGWKVEDDNATHPEGRLAVFVGDLVDRGPDSVGVLRLAMNMCQSGAALCVPGNHDDKLKRYLSGGKVSLSHGLEETAAALEKEPEEFRSAVRGFIDGLVSHLVLDNGNLVVAHAGLPADMQGRASRAVRSFALYGDTTGEMDQDGLPVRVRWAEGYTGSATVVFGHTPVPEPEWLNRTMNIDTGCVFGGRLTALRWPERDLVSVPAREKYFEPARPIHLNQRDRSDERGLDISPYLGRQRIVTPTGTVIIEEESAAAALEVMSRFAANPRWLIHLPPTMSPCETTEREGYLEHPDQALAYYAKFEAGRVVCQEKHMGSRALVLVSRSEEAAAARFGVETEGRGAIWTRTGRPFFDDKATEQTLLERIANAAEAAALWESLETDWILLDTELMPWSAKALGLIERQYRPVAEAGMATISFAGEALEAARARGVDVPEDLRFDPAPIELYKKAFEGYSWPINSVDDYRIAPFHLLASEGSAHFDKPHTWHLEHLDKLCEQGEPNLTPTPRIYADPTSEADLEKVTNWWAERTAEGSEGMVVKPVCFVHRHKGRLVQPAIKCRGKEYLRIIYGPEYDAPENLERLRQRGLSRKRALATREFGLGQEALERFVAREPLSKVHECVMGVLALESEPVDPRL